jgi:hypothetical protein
MIVRCIMRDVKELYERDYCIKLLSWERPVRCLRSSEAAFLSGPTGMLTLTQTLRILKSFDIEHQIYDISQASASCS